MNEYRYGILYELYETDSFDVVHQHFWKNSIEALIKDGFIEKVKCNNAPDDMEIINNHIYGHYRTTEKGKLHIDFHKL